MVSSILSFYCNAVEINNLLLISVEKYFNYYFNYFWQKLKNKTFVMNYYLLIKYTEEGGSGNSCWRVFDNPQEENKMV